MQNTRTAKSIGCWRRNGKYNAHKCNIGNEVFDSRREARRYSELCLLEKSGQIKNLRRQVKYILLPCQREVVFKKGIQKQGKVIEREVAYVADFVYEENGQTIVEDAKGFRNPTYVLKRKMMLYFHGIRIREV